MMTSPGHEICRDLYVRTELSVCVCGEMQAFCFLLQTFRHKVTNMHRGEGNKLKHETGAGTAACTIKQWFEMLLYTFVPLLKRLTVSGRA